MPQLDTPSSPSPPPSPSPHPAARATSSRGLASYLLRATIANWIVTLLTIAYAFVITPILLRVLDKDLYGVWSFLNGLLDYSNLLYLGLGAAFIKYLAQYRAARQEEAANRLASVVLVLYSAIGLLCLVLCGALAPAIPGLLAEPLAPADARATVIAFMLLGSRLLFAFVSTVYSGVLVAEERVRTLATINIVVILARFIAVPVLIVDAGAPLIMLALITGVISVCQAAVLAVTVARTITGLRIRPVRPTLAELRLLYGFGFRSFFIDLSAWLINYTDIIVIGLLIGAVGVAEYAVPLQLVAYGRVVVQGTMSALLPRLSAYQTLGDRPLLAAAYPLVTRITNYIAAFVALNILSLGLAFLRLWVGPAFSDSAGPILVLLTLASFCQAVSTQAAVPFYQAMHALRVPVVVLLIEAGVNLGLSLWLARPFGVTGVAAATLIPALLITSVVLPVHLCRELQVSAARLLRSSVMPSLVLLAAGVLVNLALDQVLEATSYPTLLVRAAVNGVIAVGVAAAVLPAEDLATVRRLLSGGRNRG